MKLSSTIVRYGIGLYAFMLINAVVKLAIRPILSQLGGDTLIGGYEYFLSIALIGSTIISFGGKRAWVQWAAQEGRGSELFNRLLKIIVYPAIFSILFLSFALAIHKEWLLYSWLLIAIISESTVLLGTSIARGRLRFREEARLLLLRLFLLAIAIAIYAGFVPHTLTNLYYTLGVYYLIMGIICFIIIRSLQTASISTDKPADGKQENNSFFRFSLLLWITDLASLAHTGLDRIALKEIFDLETLGRYGVVLTFLLAIEQPSNIFNEIVLPYFTKKNPSEEDYGFLCRFNLFFFTLLSQVMVILFPLLGNRLFKTDIKPLRIVLLIGVMMYLLKGIELLQTNLTIAAGKPAINRKAVIISILLYLPFLFLGSIYLGLGGTISARLLYFVFYLIIHYWIARRLFGHVIIRGFKVLGLGLPLAISSLILCHLYPGSPLIILVLPATVVLGYLFKAIPKKRALMEILRSE